jgi:hypothetical protein
MALSRVLAGQNARPVWRIFSGVRGGFKGGSCYLKMLFGTFTCTPIVGRSTSCVTATFPATLTS